MSARVAVFASGGGSNLQALLDSFNTTTERAGRVTLVISDRSDAGALRRAANAGVATRHIAVSNRDTGDIAHETLAALAEEKIDLIALAGYLRLVPSTVIAKYRDRVINVHPALLPSFGGPGMFGRHVHEAVIASGCMVSGVTVHYVDENYDEGRIIAQWPVPVMPGDDATTLAARVLRVEHMLFPVAVEATLRRLRTPNEGAGTADVGAGDDLSFALQRDAPDLAPHMNGLLHP